MEKTKYSDLEGKTVVAFSKENFVAKCDRTGISLEGKLKIETYQDLQEFAKNVSDWWKEHKKLEVKIVGPNGG